MSTKGIKVTESMRDNAVREEKRFLELRKALGPAAQKSTEPLLNLSIEELETKASKGDLAKSSVDKVMFEKFYYLHTKISSEGQCGFCRTIAQKDLKRCAQCQTYFYCNQDCQKKHWKTHKMFCRLIGFRKVGLESKLLKATRAVDLKQQWDGEPNDECGNLIRSLRELWVRSPTVMTEQLLRMPPNWTQAHGPDAFREFLSFVLGQCDMTSFQRERKAWWMVLLSLVDPSFPNYDSNFYFPGDEIDKWTFHLRPNVEAFLQEDELVDQLMILLTKDRTCSNFARAVWYIGSYGLGLYQPDDLTVKRNTLIPVFENLPTDLHHNILEFLRPEELLKFGRCSRAAAALAYHETTLTVCISCREIATQEKHEEFRIKSKYKDLQEQIRCLRPRLQTMVAETKDEVEALARAAHKDCNIFFRTLFEAKKSATTRAARSCMLLQQISILRPLGAPLCRVARFMAFQEIFFSAELQIKWEQVSRSLKQELGKLLLEFNFVNRFGL